MRYVKAIVSVLICVTLVGLLARQLPQYEEAIIMVGFAAAVVLARWLVRKL